MPHIDKLGLILVRNRKTLLVRSRGKDIWLTPGGKREDGESDEQALMREVKEELSVDLIPESIRHYGVFEAQAHGKPLGTLVRITCYTASYSGDLQPAAEIEELRWVSYAEKGLSSITGQLIIDDLKKRGRID